MNTTARQQMNFPGWEQSDNAFAVWKAMAKGLAESKGTPAARAALARAFCGTILLSYWDAVCHNHHCTWDIRSLPCPLQPLAKSATSLAHEVGTAASYYPPTKAGHLISALYTVMLPDETRSSLGAYYTPPTLVERLLEMVTEAGFDWGKGRILDPACGGGAFLAPVATRMLQSLKSTDPAFILRNIVTRLHGFEIDGFAAWMSQVLLEVAMLDICLRAGKRLPDVVVTGDTLSIPVDAKRHFDLVIGNPPYGKITLPPARRHTFKRSLYGHANLYGLFTDQAVRWARAGGLIAYVTPTSFLGGQYFKALRELLKNEAPPLMMDFVTERQGVFEDVLQETMLTVYGRGGSGNKPVTVHFLKSNGAGNPVQVQEVGRFNLPDNGEEPWFMPRDPEHAVLLKAMADMPHRLSDYGFSVSTGQLVWNRHKEQLRLSRGRNCYPLIWAESVTAEGQFNFSAIRRNHTPYFQLHGNQDYLVNREPCILIQRTTAKEQKRRLIAALLPETFIKETGGVVVENHLNMIRPTIGKSSVAPETIEALLNTRTLDLAFRCLSGSVAVSAYELNALPLPTPDRMAEFEKLVLRQGSKETIERFVAKAYGVTW